MVSKNKKVPKFMRYRFDDIIACFEENEYRYRRLCAKSEQVAPFVGTGMSNGFGCGSWEELLRKFLNNCRSQLTEEEAEQVREEIDVRNYMNAADILLAKNMLNNNSSLTQLDKQIEALETLTNI